MKEKASGPCPSKAGRKVQQQNWKGDIVLYPAHLGPEGSLLLMGLLVLAEGEDEDEGQARPKAPL